MEIIIDLNQDPSNYANLRYIQVLMSLDYFMYLLTFFTCDMYKKVTSRYIRRLN